MHPPSRPSVTGGGRIRRRVMQHKNKSEYQLALFAPISFWKALNDVRQVVLTVRQDEYFKHRGLPPIDSFRESLDVVDYYLHRVQLDGWLNNDK